MEKIKMIILKHIGNLHSINRAWFKSISRFKHLAGGFKKPIWRYTNQAFEVWTGIYNTENINAINSTIVLIIFQS